MVELPGVFKEVMQGFSGGEVNVLLLPGVHTVIATLQSALKPKWSGMAERLVKRASAGSYFVVGVHLRTGNQRARV